MADTPPALPANVPAQVKREQEDLNIEVYKKVFKKCLRAARELMSEEVTPTTGAGERALTVDIAKAIFDRFYNDQTALSSGKLQAKAMIDGMTQVLEGRR